MIGISALMKDLLLGSEAPNGGAIVEKFVELGLKPGKEWMELDEAGKCVESLHGMPLSAKNVLVN